MELAHGDKFMTEAMVAEFMACIPFMLCFNLNDGSFESSLFYFVLYTITVNISGAHLNPAVSLGVYIERQKFSKNILYLIMLATAQQLGCFCALAIGYMVRITMQEPDLTDKYYFVPSQNAFYPKIIDQTEGLPAYG